MPDNCFKRCLEFNAQYNLISVQDTLLVSVSAGPDSLFLIHYICQHFPKNEKHFIYFDHQSRPLEIIKEKKVLQDVLSSYGQDVLVKKVPVNAYKKRFSVSFEMAARACRYTFLAFYASLFKCTKVLTAHHFDDDIETLILKLNHYNSNSFYGILPKRPLKNSELIRPMLCLSKDDILLYLQKNKFDYCIDSSNFNLKFKRNYIRHVSVPELRRVDKQFNQKYALILHRSREFYYIKERMMPAISDFIINDDSAVYVSLDVFYGLSPDLYDDVISRIISYFIERLQSRFTRYFRLEKPVKTLHKQFIKDTLTRYDYTESRMSFLFDSYLIRKKGVIGLELSHFNEKSILSFNGNNDHVFNFDNKFSIQKIPFDKTMTIRSTSREAFLDASLINGPINIRTRKSGDMFIPFGMNSKKKLKRYFIDKKVPFKERDSLPLFFDQDKLLWVYGHQISNSCKITSKTTEILHIKAI